MFQKTNFFWFFLNLLSFFNCLKWRFACLRSTSRLNIKILNTSKFSTLFDSFYIKFVTFWIIVIWLEFANRSFNLFCMIFSSDKILTIDWLSTSRWELNNANMLFFSNRNESSLLIEERLELWTRNVYEIRYNELWILWQCEIIW